MAHVPCWLLDHEWNFPLSRLFASNMKYQKWLRKIFSELLSRFYDSNTETSDKTSTSTLSISFQVFCLANLRSKGPPPSVAPRFNLCGHNYCQTRQDWDFLRRNWWLFCSPFVICVSLVLLTIECKTCPPLNLHKRFWTMVSHLR